MIFEMKKTVPVTTTFDLATPPLLIHGKKTTVLPSLHSRLSVKM